MIMPGVAAGGELCWIVSSLKERFVQLRLCRT